VIAQCTTTGCWAKACVAFERVFDFFLRGGVLLPSLDLLLEHFGPRAVQVNLFARAFVHDFKSMAFQQGLAGGTGPVLQARWPAHASRQKFRIRTAGSCVHSPSSSDFKSGAFENNFKMVWFFLRLSVKGCRGF
jgi:hypothetical protein